MVQETGPRRWATPAPPTERPASDAAPVAAFDCLAGGGDMGALMRSLDWAATLVGPVEMWPQSLRTSVSIMLANHFPMAIGWGPQWVFMYNDGYRPILGANKHPRAMGSPILEAFPEIETFVAENFGRVMGGESVGFDHFLLPLDRDGSIQDSYFTFSYSPIRDETGGVGGVLVTVTEVTPRVLGERRLQTLRDLAATAADARSVDEACTASFAALRGATDVPFALLYLREQDELRLVASHGIAVGSSLAPERLRSDSGLWDVARVLAGEERVIDLDAAAGPLAATAGGGDKSRQAVAIPVHPTAHPGGVLIVGATPRTPLDADYRSFFSLVRDQIVAAINDGDAYEAERRRAEALAEIDRAKTVFFGNVSHEFRTPLALMLGPAEDALNDAEHPLDERQRERVDTVYRNGLRLQKLVNALLDFSRIEAGRIDATYEPTDLASATAEFASVFRSAVERAGLRLEVRCEPLPSPVYVDRDMWEKIVLNLLSNALKHTFTGAISVEQAAEGSEAVLRVRDTGTGIPEDELPRIFERFHRVKDARARTHEGSGIGLALVHELVRLHGATIDVASTVGQGSTFTVRVPFGSEHLPAERVGGDRALERTSSSVSPFVQEALRWLPDEGQTRAAVPVRAGASSARILVVDDNADMRAYLARLLGERWTVEVCVDGAEALERARRARPDLVLTDVMLPRLDGFGLLRALQADEGTKGVPVVMLSARAGEEATLEGIAAGAADYLVKPFSARELVARIEAQLDAARARRAEKQLRDRLSAVFMQAPAIICLLRGPQHVFDLVNPQYQALFGSRQLLGLPLREALPEIEGQGQFELIDRVYATGKAYVGTESQIFLADGEGRLIETYFTFVYQPYLEDGEVRGIFVFGFDVTTQVRARQGLELADRQKDEFLAMLAHELRNPLAPMLNAVEALDRLGTQGVTATEMRSILRRQTEKLGRLVDDLLDVSRLRSGKIALQPSPVDLRNVIQTSHETFRLGSGAARSVTLSLPARVLPVSGDALRLEQVFGNLLDNAAKFTAPGQAIVISAADRDGEAEIHVKDSGDGIEPGMLERIFDIFVQGEATIDRRRGGLGLGLALVRGIVEQHGGSVVARSAGRGQGADFVVRIPLAAGRTAAPADERVVRGSVRDVVLVEDNADAREALAALLELDGHTVRVAADSEAALRVFRERVPDVAFVDIGLPGRDGYETARALRSVAPGVVLVALTGYGQPSDREHSREAGFDAHLVKPVGLDELNEALRLSHRV